MKYQKNVFTAAEKEILYGFAEKIGRKHKCSGAYVRYIINGKRAMKSDKAQDIVKDLNALLALLLPDSPEKQEP